MDWHELEKKKVTELREMAKEKLELTGTSGMHKADLVEALAQAMGIEKPHKVAHGKGKTAIKQQIRALKAQRDEAMGKHDAATLQSARHEIHKLRRKLRRMARLEG
jgi:hypothetical protein